MTKAYLGIDIGSISTKGVIIDKDNNVLASTYIWTKGNPIKAAKEVLENLKKQIDIKKIKLEDYPYFNYFYYRFNYL